MDSGPAASAEVGRPPAAPQVEDGEDPREQVGNRPARTASSIDGFDGSGLGVPIFYKWYQKWGTASRRRS